MVSGGDPSQAEIPANSGAGPRSASRSAWARRHGHAVAATPSATAATRTLRRVAKGRAINATRFQAAEHEGDGCESASHALFNARLMHFGVPSGRFQPDWLTTGLSPMTPAS